MAKFETGKPKTGGRKKGTPNKRTQILHELLDDVGLNVVERLAAILNGKKLSDTAKANILLELMQYLFPKRKAVELTGHDGESLAGAQVVVMVPSNGREANN